MSRAPADTAWLGTTRLSWGLLGLVVLATAARLTLVFAGPDLDTDAYGHAMAGRRLLLDPSDLSVHWVWLPVIHLIHAASAALGFGLQGVRLLNVGLSALAPLLFAALLRRELAESRSRGALGEEDSAVYGLAPWLMAIEPISLFLGASAQPEPLFVVLVLGTLLAWSRQAPILAAVLLGVAVLTRYEAWVLPAVFAVLWWTGARGGSWPVRARGLAPAVLPALVIAVWCWLTSVQSGEPLHFLRLNSEFASGYFSEQGAAAGALGRAVWYLVQVPLHHMFGWPFGLALFGCGWLLRAGPRAPMAVWLSLLCFVTYGFVAKKHLGLDRHAAVIVPLYALALAAGVARVSRLIAQRGPGQLLGARRIGRLGVLSALVMSWVASFDTVPRFAYMLPAQRAAEAPFAAAARVLSSEEPSRVYCDIAAVEVLSNLSPERFLRYRLDDVTDWQLSTDLERFGVVVAASEPSRLARLAPRGRELFRDSAVLVVRFERGGITR